MEPIILPPWLFMWLLAAALFAVFKLLTWLKASVPRAPLWLHLVYLFAWPGLDAVAFLRKDRLPDSRRPTFGDWSFAAAKLVVGALLIWLAVPSIPADLDLVRGWVGMIGIVFILHFGLLHLLSCAWRSAGIDAKPLMDWPVAATSVSDFWGRRWNTAFRDFAHRFFFRPFNHRVGPRLGIAAGFLFSGLVHDLVISIPAGAGYGLPTLFFCLQALALLFERSAAGRAVGLGHGWRGWAFTAVVVVAPAGLLFHSAFLREVILPFLDVIGAGSAHGSPPMGLEDYHA